MGKSRACRAGRWGWWWRDQAHVLVVDVDGNNQQGLPFKIDARATAYELP
jgi:hypothetical protein